MSNTLLRDLIATKLGNEPETFQFFADHEPQNSWFQELFSIDLRALAALRILLGTIVMLSVFRHFGTVELMFTEHGVLSRSLNQQLLGGSYWSIFWLNGSAQFARSLLVATGLAAGFFVLGYQTKIANLLLLVLVWSIQVRNPLLLSGGDVLLRMLLFWSLFLPTNAIWSVDASQNELRPQSWKIASVATLAIMLQVVSMYFFSGLSKLNPFWLNGDAVQYALQLEMSVKPWGSWLIAYPWLTRLATWATLIAELMILFVMFIPRMHHFNRGMMLGFFLLMHTGIWLTMSIGLFSLTAIVAWVIFIPGDIWNSWAGQPVGYDEKQFYRDSSSTSARISRVVCWGFLGYITVQNLVFALGPAVSQRLSVLEHIGQLTMTIQQFHMFSQPPLFSPWFEYRAQLDQGQWVDLFYRQPSDAGAKPESVYDYMQTHTWRRIHWNLITHPLAPPRTELIYQEIRSNLLLAAVKRWNGEYLDNPVIQAELKCYLEPIRIREDVQRPQLKNHLPFELIWASYPKL